MRSYSVIILMCVTLALPNAHAQKKLAQTGFQFLSVGTDARATALGEAFTTITGSSVSLFYNPAGMASMPAMIDLSVSNMTWIADINYYAGSIAFKPGNGQYGVFGLSFLSVDYGEFLWTRVADNQKGYEDITDWGSPGAFMLGSGYAIELSDRFAVGGQIKYVTQNLGTSYIPIYTETDTTQEEKDYNIGVVAFDFGTVYRTGFKSLAFGMSVRNFSREIKFEKEGFQLPLTFKIGISMDLLDFMPEWSNYQSLMLSVDAVHPRSYPEFVSIGAEYAFMNMFFLRGGYVDNQSEYGVTAGFGIKTFGLAIDYSYTPFDVFNNINRISVKFSY